MPQNTNSTKNLIISLVLLTFIVSSGAFIVYQLIKKQSSSLPPSYNISKSSLIIDQGINSNSSLVKNGQANGDEMMKKDETNKPSGINAILDPYISGQSITGVVDNTDKIQSLVIRFTEIGQENNVLEFKPTIDDQKNFKILLDDNTKNGDYKVEYNITDLDQKETKSESLIKIKSKVNTDLTKQTVGTETQSSKNESEKQSDINSTTLVNNVNIDSPDGGVSNSENALQNSRSLVNTDAIRTGGTSITILLTSIIIVFLGYVKLIISSNKKSNLNTLFGKIK